MPDLRQIQRWMQSVIMHPRGVAEGAASADARAHLGVGPAGVEDIVTRSRTLSAEERLGIYHSAYHARLLECLREEFPVMVQTLGAEVFDVFAVGYLQRYPSRSYTLNRLADDFPRYLAETRPEAAEDDGPFPTMPDFLIDLATLEWTIGDVFDGPGVEGERLLDAAQLLAVPAERRPDVRLRPVPCLRLLGLRHPVQEYYTAVRSDQEPAAPAPADTFLAVTRRDYVVCHYTLSPMEYETLGVLVAGETLGGAVASAAEKAGAEHGDLAGLVRHWFEGWAARGFFRSVSLDGERNAGPEA
jgi:hypothetical protein